ncbi:hypothetical protein AVEN_150539-1 [Araneus ventricosus]|uniref:Uncharacterized protein n=1 Tax=Araneus ventricosus TaxID=182803 RepID=A0A4Y2E5Q0_ARAVE|nr:hypothetical protein AVEN_150539-1 [Araneus ventricosus]
MPFPPNSGGMNGTTVTLEGTSTTSFQRSRLPQHRGNDQKSCLQRDMAHLQLTLRDLASEPPSCGELGTPLHFATSCRHTSSYHFTKPSNELENLWWKESSTTHCQEFK